MARLLRSVAQFPLAPTWSGPLLPATTDHEQDFEGASVIGQPSALVDRWGRRLSDLVLAFASGWVRVPARALALTGYEEEGEA